jgi:hypothetical protein
LGLSRSFQGFCGSLGEDVGPHFGNVSVEFLCLDSIALCFQLRFHAREGPEQQLGEVAEGDGILAVDQLAGTQFNDIGEEGVYLLGGSKVAGGVEKFGGESFRIWLGRCGFAEVMGTQGVLVRSGEHAAALAARTDVLALLIGVVL